MVNRWCVLDNTGAKRLLKCSHFHPNAKDKFEQYLINKYPLIICSILYCKKRGELTNLTPNKTAKMHQKLEERKILCPRACCGMETKTR